VEVKRRTLTRAVGAGAVGGPATSDIASLMEAIASLIGKDAA